MHGISYAALMLVVDGLPDTSGKKEKKHKDPTRALLEAGITVQPG